MVIHEGDSFSLPITVYDAEDNPVVLSGATVEGLARKGSERKMGSVSITNPSGGEFVITFGKSVLTLGTWLVQGVVTIGTERSTVYSKEVHVRRSAR